MGETILEISGINRTYIDDKDNSVEVLKDINLTLERGEFVSIIGASGCGKTTLLRLIAGLDKPERGEILLGGALVREPHPQSGYVFQQGTLLPWLTVEKNIQGVRKENKERVPHYIGLIGMKGFEKSYPHQISGGMAQRVAIARALINNPEVLLLDEPMGALDSFTRADLQDKLLELRKENNTTMLLVTHDIDEAIYLSDRVVIMTPRPGKISEILDIHLPHPRHRGSVEFLSKRRDILEKLQLASAQPQPEYTI